MEHGQTPETVAHADDTRPLVYAAGVAGLIALAMGVYTATQAEWFASGMAFVGGLVLVGGMVMELRHRN